MEQQELSFILGKVQNGVASLESSPVATDKIATLTLNTGSQVFSCHQTLLSQVSFQWHL
jgi:hypothetical protein